MDKYKFTIPKEKTSFDNTAMMPRDQPKLRPAKGQEEGRRRRRKASTKRAAAFEDASGGKRSELEFEEMMQTFVRKLMKAKITTPTVKNSES